MIIVAKVIKTSWRIADFVALRQIFWFISERYREGSEKTSRTLKSIFIRIEFNYAFEQLFLILQIMGSYPSIYLIFDDIGQGLKFLLKVEVNEIENGWRWKLLLRSFGWDKLYCFVRIYIKNKIEDLRCLCRLQAKFFQSLLDNLPINICPWFYYFLFPNIYILTFF